MGGHTRRFVATISALGLALCVLAPQIIVGEAAATDWYVKNLSRAFSGNVAIAVSPDDDVFVAFFGYHLDSPALVCTRVTDGRVSEEYHLELPGEPEHRSVSIATGRDGSVHICVSPWPEYSNLLYVTNAGGSWVKMAVPVGSWRSGSDIAVDSEGRAHIIASTYVMDHQDPEGLDYSYDYLKHVVIQGGEYEVTDLVTTELNEAMLVSPSLALDSEDGVHLLFERVTNSGPPDYIDNNASLEYLRGTFGDFEIRSVYGRVLVPGTSLMSGLGGCLAVDESGKGHVAFYVFEDLAFRLAYLEDAWNSGSYEVVGYASDLFPLPCSIAVDSEGSAHIAYYAIHVESWLYHNYTVVYATNSGGEWEFSSVDDSEVTEWFGTTEIALNSTGVPFIAYHFSEATGAETADFFIRFASTEEFPVGASRLVLWIGAAMGAIVLGLVLAYYAYHRRLLRNAQG